MSVISNDLRWTLVNDYFQTYGFVRHQLDGFHDFIENKLPLILKENSDIRVQSSDRRRVHVIQFGKTRIVRPRNDESNGATITLFPSEAKVRSLTYNLTVRCNITHVERVFAPLVNLSTKLAGSRPVVLRCKVLNRSRVSCEGQEIAIQPALTDAQLTLYRDKTACLVHAYIMKTHLDYISLYSDDPDKVVGDMIQIGADRLHIRDQVPLFKIPCMVKSRFCNLHQAASKKFCANDAGGYFIINGNEKVLVSQLKLRINTIFVFETKPTSRYVYKAEVRSLNVAKWRSTSTLAVLLLKHTRNAFVCHIPFVNSRSKTALDIPFDILTGALGGDATCMDWLNSRHDQTAPLDSEVLPHLGLTSDVLTRKKKIFFLNRMRNRVMAVFRKQASVDDRDHVKNRRADAAGPLLAILFRQLFRNHLKTKKIQLRRTIDLGKPVNIETYLHFRKITSGLRYHFATGNWSLTKGTNTGVVQLLNTMSVQAARSHLNRVSTPMNREGKSILPRMLHCSTYGILCPAETPEGASCGLLQQKSMLAHITVGLSVRGIRLLSKLLATHGMQAVTVGALRNTKKNTIVSICGDVAGFVPTPAVKDWVSRLRRLRCNQTIPIFTGIVHDKVTNQVHLHVQPGRLVRPLLHMPVARELVRSGAPVTWSTYLEKGGIVYVDKAEEADMVIDGTTFDDVTPSAMMSSAVASIPFSCRNQAPRNVYQSSMCKQAISFPSLVSKHHFNSVHAYTLNYPQRGLLETRFKKLSCAPTMPSTFCAVVAIMIRGG